MKDTGRFPRITPAIYYADPARAIDWLCDVFGFEVRMRIEGPGGRIEHSELVLKDGVVMVGGDASVSERPGTAYRQSPRSVGGANTQSLMVYVDDVDGHCARTRAKGGKVTLEPKTDDYGEEYWSDRAYEAVDLEGHRWWFVQRLRDPVK